LTETLQDLLSELERIGLEDDAAISERPRRMLNISRDTGEFLAVLLRATNARRVLEIGTSNGYSTLWLAHACDEIGGHVTTIESSEYKLTLAATNFERAGLSHAITQVRGDAGRWLQGAPDSGFDLIFLDSERSEYSRWWPNIRRILRKGGLLVVDNANSHPGEMAPFVALVSADHDFRACTVPVGNGEYLATRSLQGP
jgi:predicted O-methyltransferase YrrM